MNESILFFAKDRLLGLFLYHSNMSSNHSIFVQHIHLRFKKKSNNEARDVQNFLPLVMLFRALLARQSQDNSLDHACAESLTGIPYPWNVRELFWYSSFLDCCEPTKRGKSQVYYNMSSLDEKMAISELEAVTFHKGHLTNGRRLAPVQQIQSGFSLIQIVPWKLYATCYVNRNWILSRDV